MWAISQGLDLTFELQPCTNVETHCQPPAGSAKLQKAFVLVIYIITSNNWAVWCMSCVAVSTNSAVWALQLSQSCEVCIMRFMSPPSETPGPWAASLTLPSKLWCR